MARYLPNTAELRTPVRFRLAFVASPSSLLIPLADASGEENKICAACEDPGH
jgi:hypothetical protein